MVYLRVHLEGKVTVQPVYQPWCFLISWGAHPVAPAKKGCLLEQWRQFISIDTWSSIKDTCWLCTCFQNGLRLNSVCLQPEYVLLINSQSKKWNPFEDQKNCCYVYLITSNGLQCLVAANAISDTNRSGWDGLMETWGFRSLFSGLGHSDPVSGAKYTLLLPHTSSFSYRLSFQSTGETWEEQWNCQMYFVMERYPDF